MRQAAQLWWCSRAGWRNSWLGVAQCGHSAKIYRSVEPPAGWPSHFAKSLQCSLTPIGHKNRFVSTNRYSSSSCVISRACMVQMRIGWSRWKDSIGFGPAEDRLEHFLPIVLPGDDRHIVSEIRIGDQRPFSSRASPAFCFLSIQRCRMSPGTRCLIQFSPKAARIRSSMKRLSWDSNRWRRSCASFVRSNPASSASSSPSSAGR